MTASLRRGALGALIAGCLAAAGCQSDAPEMVSPPPDRAPAPTVGSFAASADTASDSIWVGDPPTLVPGPLSAPPTGWTTRTVTVTRGDGVATLTDVRAAAHPGFDRVVFTLATEAPGYHVEYVDRPAYTCGSGEALYLEGDAWLLVRLTPAQAHTDAGEPTVAERRRRFDLPVLREAALTCDFEADVTWVLGLSSPGGYSVTELEGPSRLVVDMRR